MLILLTLFPDFMNIVKRVTVVVFVIKFGFSAF